jgi:hypothetical protein
MSFQSAFEQTPPSKMRKNSKIIMSSQETVKIVQKLDFNLVNNKRTLSFRLNKGPLVNRFGIKKSIGILIKVKRNNTIL